jgi:hypothetical protein
MSFRARRRAWIVVILVCVGAAVVWVCFRDANAPRYNRVSLKGWVDRLLNAKTAEERRHAEDALRRIGDRGIVQLLEMTRATEPKWKSSLFGLLQKQRIVPIPYKSVERRRLEAARAVDALGPAGRPIIYEWAKVLTNNAGPTQPLNSPWDEAVVALSYMGAEALPVLISAYSYSQVPGAGQMLSSCIQNICDLDAEDSIPVLTRLTRDPVAGTRVLAAGYLEEVIASEGITPKRILEPKIVRQGIIGIASLTRDESPKIRSQAVESLRNLAKKGVPINQLLTELMAHPEAEIRVCGSNAVQLIESSTGN